MSTMLERKLKIIDKDYTLEEFLKPILTRFLYLYDEVAVSYIHALLSKPGKEQTKECYFWASELYYSGFVEESWRLLWFIYYDFYYLHNPHFESFLFKKHKIGDLKSMLTVTKNLVRMHATHEAFSLRQYTSQISAPTKDTISFRGKRPTWIRDYPVKYHKLFRSLQRKLYHQVCILIPDNDDIDDVFMECVKLYYTTHSPNKIAHLDDILNQHHILNSSYKESYENVRHKVLSLFCLCEFNSNFDYHSKKKIFISANNDEIEYVQSVCDDDIPLNSNGNPQIYKTLEYKRCFPITPHISHFHLSRHTRSNIHEDVMKRWEYFAYRCPLWKERFDSNDITIIHDGENGKNGEMVIFNNDAELESFYETYGYDPDEQSSEVHYRGIPNLSPTDSNDICSPMTTCNNKFNVWCNTIFNCNPIIELDNDNYFLY
tara:strand:+ start:513 stop:1805 length:1293 start_codon:yes stop_codon:yes gene_type:complete